jgi:CRP/FNR family transcriptional regulator, anaerobic regulatory protein
MQNELEKYIQSFFGVNQEDLQTISTLFKPLKLPKDDYFLKTEVYANRLGFLQAGILREFLYHDGKEVTKWISTKGYFIVDLSSFFFGKPARWNIQALTDCELFVIYQQDYAQITQLVPKWQELEKLFIARCFSILEDRIVTHLSLSAEERYNAFFAFAPELFNQVPLQYLASMLGMTPETFSRIRKRQASRTS